MRIHIIRHGDPNYETNTLTALGHREAAALARRMSSADLDRIYSSPMGRAVETAEYTADLTGLTPEILDWTAELQIGHIDDPQIGETAAWNIAGDRVRSGSRAPSDDDWDHLPEFDGYPFRQWHDRLIQSSDGFLEKIGYRRDGGVYRIQNGAAEQNIAIFCHAGFGVSWLAHLLQIPLSLAWCGLYWAPTSVTTVRFESRSPGVAVPRALAIGDTSHLYAETIPVGTRGIMPSLTEQ